MVTASAPVAPASSADRGGKAGSGHDDDGVPSQLAEASSRVEVRFGTSQPQRRWTVALRIILAIPQFFVLVFVGIGAFVVVFLGWFAALFTGRLPAVVRQVPRSATSGGPPGSYAYAFLMTDVYPPFALDPDPTYPVDVTVVDRPAQPGRRALPHHPGHPGVPSSRRVLAYGMQCFALITGSSRW